MNIFFKVNCRFLDKIYYSLLRSYHNNGEVRVRFAPSPTGYLHLGGLRTALYNYLFAKRQNGKFILRIEDTDQSRLVKDATEKMIEDLNWVGIKVDEGPFIEGSHGPYFQSKRLNIYRNEVKQLLENGSAYYCFCTERRLELLRKEAVRARLVPKYDNKCRYLTSVQISDKLASNEPFCIRFKLTPYSESLTDIVYGGIVNDVSENEGDPVIMKSDGFPTYHLANVVDDHLMGITHVFRGVEWQISTTKHLLIYKALNWKPPQFGHLPLLVNNDGTKLSKRQGDIRIGSFKDRGIYPQALINYVCQAGGGFPIEEKLQLKFYAMSELISRFDISKVNANPSRLNPCLLNEFNRIEIMRKVTDQQECEKLVNEVKQLVKKAFSQSNYNLDLDDDYIRRVLQWSAYRLNSLSNLVEGQLSFLWILPSGTNEFNIEKAILSDLITSLSDEQFIKSNLQKSLKEFSKQKKLVFKIFMKSLRSLLSGLKEGPGVAEMMEILGKENTLQRIRNAINK